MNELTKASLNAHLEALKSKAFLLNAKLDLALIELDQQIKELKQLLEDE